MTRIQDYPLQLGVPQLLHWAGRDVMTRRARDPREYFLLRAGLPEVGGTVAAYVEIRQPGASPAGPSTSREHHTRWSRQVTKVGEENRPGLCDVRYAGFILRFAAREAKRGLIIGHAK